MSSPVKIMRHFYESSMCELLPHVYTQYNLTMFTLTRLIQ